MASALPVGGADGQASFPVVLILAGGLYCLFVIPTCLAVFTGEKIAADPHGFPLAIVSEGEGLVYLGWSLGGLAVLPLSDRIGRKPIIYSLLLVGFLAVACSLTTEQSLIFRASQLAVGGLCLAGVLGLVLSVEAAPPRWQRHVVVGINIAWYGFSIIMALVCEHWTRFLPWRLETALWYAPYALITVLGCLFLKEPSRASLQLPDKSDAQAGTGIAQLFSREYRLIMANSCLAWMGASLGYFGLTFASGSLSSNRYVNVALFGIVDMLSTAAGGVVMDMAEPVRVQAVSFALASAIMLGMSALPPGPYLVQGALLGRFLIDVSFITCYRLSVEHFPTECRASALGMCNFTGRMASVAAPMFMVVPAWAVFWLMSGVCLVASLASSCLPPVKREPSAFLAAGRQDLLEDARR